jgi:tetratricopeptide (TPR) repeat protein
VLGELRNASAPLRSQAITLANLGKSYERLGEHQSAQACFEHSLSLSDQCSDFEWSYDTALSLSTVFERQGRSADGRKALRRAIEYNELTRRGLPLEDAPRTAFARGRSDAYARMIDHYLARSRVADAFETVQRAKSRALVELSGLGDLTGKPPETAEASMLLDREAALLAELRPYAHGRDVVAGTSLLRTKTDAYAELQELYDRLATIDPNYVTLRSGRPLTVQQLASVLQSQDRETVIVEYFLESDRLLTFIMRSGWDFPECVQQSLDLAQIAALREDTERQIVHFKSEGPQTWTQLASVLIEPISHYLREDDLVYLVPHDILHGLPIHALPIMDVPLCWNHDVAYLPAASILPVCQSRVRSTSGLRMLPQVPRTLHHPR